MEENKEVTEEVTQEAVEQQEETPQLDESKFPKTKGKRIDGMRFYEVDGQAYPAITTGQLCTLTHAHARSRTASAVTIGSHLLVPP